VAYKFGSFFVPNHQPIIIATFCLVVVSACSLVYHFIFKKKQDKMSFYSNIAIVIFGGLTVFFHNPSFIKIKITLINIFFGGLMVYNYFAVNPPIKKIFEGKIVMKNKAWKEFSLRLALMFFVIAIGNEIVYRNFPEATWVKYKVFCVPIFSLLYFVVQVRFLARNTQRPS
jgi:intracellular septation protein